MINQILADYYEEKGFIKKAIRLRRKSSLVIYNDGGMIVYIRGNGWYFGYNWGDGFQLYDNCGKAGKYYNSKNNIFYKQVKQ